MLHPAHAFGNFAQSCSINSCVMLDAELLGVVLLVERIRSYGESLHDCLDRLYALWVICGEVERRSWSNVV